MLGQLKNHPDTRHLPVVMIGDPGMRIDGLRAGAAAFVEEPFEAEQLGDALRPPRAEPEDAKRIALVADGGRGR